jgi:hypothetical protein
MSHSWNGVERDHNFSLILTVPAAQVPYPRASSFGANSYTSGGGGFIRSSKQAAQGCMQEPSQVV